MMSPAPSSLDEVVMEMLRLQKALPPRPSLQELDMANDTISRIDDRLSSQLEALLHMPRPPDVPPPVFFVLQEMRKEALLETSHEQKRLSQTLLHLENRHQLYDSWIQQAHNAISENHPPKSDTNAQLGTAKSSSDDAEKTERMNAQMGTGKSPSDDAQNRAEKELMNAQLGTAKSPSDDAENRAQKEPMNAQLGTDDAEWESSSLADDHLDRSNRISKSSTVGTSDSLSSFARSLSWSSFRAETQPKRAISIEEENKPKNTLVTSAEPQSALKVLSTLDRVFEKRQKSLDLRGAFLKEIEWVPESLGRLTWLTDLNLSGNRLTILPESIGDLCNLVNLDVSANQLVAIPETLGRLTCLETLNIENNKIEELPWTIGQCTALIELAAGFNQLKALPEATGKLTHLRLLSVHLNSLNSLPTTLASMTSLTDLDAHFNQLESIPESLCMVTTLTRLNIASNFTDLKELPQHIGKLQKLKALNISYNHLTVLPASFSQLTNLQDLQLEGNPLRIPPLHIAQQGKEAVLKYMADYSAGKVKGKKKIPKRSFLQRLICTCSTHLPLEEEAM